MSGKSFRSQRIVALSLRSDSSKSKGSPFVRFVLLHSVLETKETTNLWGFSLFLRIVAFSLRYDMAVNNSVASLACIAYGFRGVVNEWFSSYLINKAIFLLRVLPQYKDKQVNNIKCKHFVDAN